MTTAVIVDALRTPGGRRNGKLRNWHAVDLASEALRAIASRNDLDPSLIDDVIMGCVSQTGEQAFNVGRNAVLAAGWPESVPATTIDRQCGSSQQAMHFAAQGVIAGAYDAAIACGVEMMSLVPMRANRLGRDDLGPLLRARYPEGLIRQGISAELIAARWNLGRDELDEFALRSHRLASAAREQGRLRGHLIPVPRPGGGTVTDDEGIRPDTSAERLAALPAAFADEEMSRRFPEIGWRVTAGNSSPITDGAAAVLIMDADRAEALGLRPRAAVTGFAVVGDDPVLMLTGIIPATRRLLERTGIGLDQIDLAEVNEAFSSVVLAWLAEFGYPAERLNVDGGAIAYGHPVGASGGRLLAACVDNLERTKGRYALMTMCESGGMANATLLERAA